MYIMYMSVPAVVLWAAQADYAGQGRVTRYKSSVKLHFARLPGAPATEIQYTDASH